MDHSGVQGPVIQKGTYLDESGRTRDAGTGAILMPGFYRVPPQGNPEYVDRLERHNSGFKAEQQELKVANKALTADCMKQEQRAHRLEQDCNMLAEELRRLRALDAVMSQKSNEAQVANMFLTHDKENLLDRVQPLPAGAFDQAGIVVQMADAGHPVQQARLEYVLAEQICFIKAVENDNKDTDPDTPPYYEGDSGFEGIVPRQFPTIFQDYSDDIYQARQKIISGIFEGDDTFRAGNMTKAQWGSIGEAGYGAAAWNQDLYYTQKTMSNFSITNELQPGSKALNTPLREWHYRSAGLKPSDSPGMTLDKAAQRRGIKGGIAHTFMQDIRQRNNLVYRLNDDQFNAMMEATKAALK